MTEPANRPDVPESPGPGEPAGGKLGHIGMVAYRLATAGVFLWFLGVCLLGVASFWQWGHNGYNGAAFSQAARNSLRFHIIGEAQYYMGIAPPPKAEVYTHHPMALHFHLMAAFKLLGFHEWAGRIIPAAYSFAGLVLLYVIVRRYWGKLEALAAIAIYALIPLHLIFANMIDHEQGSIFWCLLFLFGYTRWLESAKLRFVGLCFAAVSMAVQFDWPGYYIAFFVAVHALLHGIVHQTRWLQWRREYSFIPAFSAVVLLNAALFFGYIYHLRGSFDEMIGAFHSRSSNPEGVWHRLWERSVDMYGYIPIALLALWLLSFLVRIPMRRIRLRDFFPAVFLLAQAVHSLLFRQAGYVHSYWTYYAGPAIAIGGATVLVGAIRGGVHAISYTAATLARLRGPNVVAPRGLRIASAAILSTALLAPLLLVQARYARKQLAWGHSTGFGSYIQPYDDQYLEIRWVQDVVRRFNRTNAEFHLYPASNWRIEWTSYLDSPWQALASVSRIHAPRPAPKGKHQIYMIDMKGVADRTALVAAMVQHPTIVYDDRFLVLDMSSTRSTFESYTSEELRPTLLWRWLVSPIEPPLRWKPSPHPTLDRAKLRPVVTTLGTNVFGGSGGTTSTWNCPEGYLLTALAGTVSAGKPSIASLQPICRILTPKGPLQPTLATLEGPRFGPATGKPFRLDCGPRGVIVGIHGRQGKVLHALGVSCAAVSTSKPDGPLTWTEATRVDAVGGSEGTSFDYACGTGSGGWSVRVATGALVDSAGVTCGVADPAFLSTGGAIARELQVSAD